MPKHLSIKRLTSLFALVKKICLVKFIKKNVHIVKTIRKIKDELSNEKWDAPFYNEVNFKLYNRDNEKLNSVLRHNVLH